MPCEIRWPSKVSIVPIGFQLAEHWYTLIILIYYKIRVYTFLPNGKLTTNQTLNKWSHFIVLYIYDVRILCSRSRWSVRAGRSACKAHWNCMCWDWHELHFQGVITSPAWAHGALPKRKTSGGVKCKPSHIVILSFFFTNTYTISRCFLRKVKPEVWKTTKVSAVTGSLK